MFSFGKKKTEKEKNKSDSQAKSSSPGNTSSSTTISRSDTQLATVHRTTTTYYVERTQRISTHSDSRTLSTFERSFSGSDSPAARSSLRSISDFRSPSSAFESARSNFLPSKTATDAKIYQPSYVKTSTNQYVPKLTSPSTSLSSINNSFPKLSLTSSNLSSINNNISNSPSSSSSSLETKVKKADEKSTNGKKNKKSTPTKTPTIVVKKTGAKYDHNQLVPTYQTHSKKRGRALIINNMKFIEEDNYRHGAELDEKNISELFKQMGFEIVPGQNVKRDKLLSTTKSFANTRAWNSVDICVVVIMSHGTKHNNATQIMCSDEKIVSTDEIIDMFTVDKCSYLQNKPKIFIFQCCRGNAKDQVQTDARPIRESKPRNCADMLIAHSTIPGYVSHRDPETGSWYIQTVCEVFSREAHHLDVESMLKIVDDNLSSFETVSSRTTKSGSRQTSSYESWGFKRCYFHP